MMLKATQFLSKNENEEEDLESVKTKVQLMFMPNMKYCWAQFFENKLLLSEWNYCPRFEYWNLNKSPSSLQIIVETDQF